MDTDITEFMTGEGLPWLGNTRENDTTNAFLGDSLDDINYEEYVDVLFMGEQGVILPGMRPAWIDEHNEVLTSDHVTFNPETGAYEYSIPVPDHVSERIDAHGIPAEAMEDKGDIVKTDSGYVLKGESQTPGDVSFILEAVETAAQLGP